jgi:hypothetical protein
VFVSVEVNGLSLRMELDTGSDNSVVGSKVWEELGSPKLHGGPSLTAYGGYSLPVLGAMNVSVTFKGVQQQLELVVVRADATALLGRIWMAAFPELQTWLRNAPGVHALPVDYKQVRTRSRLDLILSSALRFTIAGWPEVCPSEDLRPYWLRRRELTVQDDCLLWGMRVVIPPPLRAGLLYTLHEGHPGVVRMNGLARYHLWWPNVDKDIEHVAAKCDSCPHSGRSNFIRWSFLLVHGSDCTSTSLVRSTGTLGPCTWARTPSIPEQFH